MGNLICRIHVAVGKIRHLVSHGFSGVQCLFGVIQQFVRVCLHHVFAGLHIPDGFLYQVVEPIHLRAQGFRLVQLNERLHLSHDATHILPSVDGAVVGTLIHHACLTSCDASHIVAGMLIAHSSCIGAKSDIAIGTACDTTGVHTAVNLHIGIGVIHTAEPCKTHLVILFHPFRVIVDSRLVYG